MKNQLGIILLSCASLTCAMNNPSLHSTDHASRIKIGIEIIINQPDNETNFPINNAFLFNETVEKNITYSTPTADKEEIILACKNANAHDPDVLFFSGDQIYESVGGYGFVRPSVVSIS